MDLRHQPELAELLVDREAPCLSLYQPTHRSHPDNQQDPIRFRNLVKTLEDSLRLKHPTHEQRQLLARFHHLADDGGFWRNTYDGLAIFGGANFFRIFKLQRAVSELAIVADTFHTKPLVRIVQSADRYQVLALSRKAFRLFEGNRDVLDEVHPSQGVSQSITDALKTEPAEAHQGVVSKGSAGSVHHGSRSKKDEIDSDTERFFRAVDRAILEHHSKPSGLPLILARSRNTKRHSEQSATIPTSCPRESRSIPMRSRSMPCASGRGTSSSPFISLPSPSWSMSSGKRSQSGWVPTT